MERPMNGAWNATGTAAPPRSLRPTPEDREMTAPTDHSTNGSTDRSTNRSSGSYDVIVVGARCAGSPTAMLLARRGYRVLVVDRAAFPSDTASTHLVHAAGMAALRRWGL